MRGASDGLRSRVRGPAIAAYAAMRFPIALAAITPQAHRNEPEGCRQALRGYGELGAASPVAARSNPIARAK